MLGKLVIAGAPKTIVDRSERGWQMSKRSRMYWTMLVLAGGMAGWEAVAMGASPSGFGPGGSAAMRASQGYLGVDIHDVSDEEVTPLKLKEARGAKIVRVDHDGPAWAAGLREHDVVLGMNGQAIEGEDQLRRMLRETPSGRTLTLVISRDGQIQTVTAQMGNREDVERQAWQHHLAPPVADAAPGAGGEAAADAGRGGRGDTGPRGGAMGFFHGSGTSGILTGHGSERGLLAGASGTGAMLEALSPQLAEFFGAPNGAGLLVRSVAANSPAAEGGMKAGDVVVKVNQIAVVSGSDWTKVTHESKGRPVTILVLRDKREQTLTIVPDGKRRSCVEFPLPGLDRFAGMSLAGMRTVIAELRPHEMDGIVRTQ